MTRELDLETRRKRLLYRSVYRGNKENDILFGQFARAHIAELSAAELDQYEQLLARGDNELFDWITGQAEAHQDRLWSDPLQDAPGAPLVEALENGTGYHQRLERVLAHAARLALDRGASVIRTGDLLRGVVHTYGNLFEPGLDVSA